MADVARQDGRFDEICFLDDKARGDDVIGRSDDLKKLICQSTSFFPAFGNNTLRLEWLNRLLLQNADVPSIIHKTAYVSPSSVVSRGTIVMPNAVVNTNTKIKIGCLINCGAIVDHDCILNECVHVCLGAIVKAENSVPACLKIEANQVVDNGTFR